MLYLPWVLVAVWLVIWRVKFEKMEQTFGLLGLLLFAFAVALWHSHPDWGRLADEAGSFGPPGPESWASYWYYAIALFGAAMTPYEVFFFSSGGVEEGWTPRDLMEERANVLIGFPLGGTLSLSIAALTTVVLLPVGISVDTLGQVTLPVASELGVIGLIVVLVGIFAATFGAGLETALSCGSTIAQYFGWQWGKFVRPRESPRFHLVIIVTLIVGAMVLLTSVDPRPARTELNGIVDVCSKQTHTQIAWLETRMKQAAPQALVVAGG
ncbi:MAG TPA: divalent metal cation transporter [Nocardioidaceae bacterium]|jgi:Mn2+/Fe2+ NRAMP family transporter